METSASPKVVLAVQKPIADNHLACTFCLFSLSEEDISCKQTSSCAHHFYQTPLTLTAFQWIFIRDPQRLKHGSTNKNSSHLPMNLLFNCLMFFLLCNNLLKLNSQIEIQSNTDGWHTKPTWSIGLLVGCWLLIVILVDLHVCNVACLLSPDGSYTWQAHLFMFCSFYWCSVSCSLVW